MDEDEGTVEMPMSPEVRELLVKKVGRWHRFRFIYIIAAAALWVGAILVVPTFGWEPAVAVLMIVFLGSAWAGTGWLLFRMVTAPLRRDLADGHYLRSRGLVRFRNEDDGTTTFEIDGFPLMVRNGAFSLIGEGERTVDFAKHSRLVLAVYDEHGNPLYLATPGSPELRIA